MSDVSLGVAGTLGPAAIARIAAAAEAAGFHALWVNDTPQGDALVGLHAAAAATSSLVLATGVIPLDRRPVQEIIAAAHGLPVERVVLGVGSGARRTGPVALVRTGLARLREETSARIMVGALGPRMRHLAATESEGPLLSWLTPEAAAVQAREARAASSTTHVTLYVRAAVDASAGDRLAAEAERYASVPGYAANFARLGTAARDAVIDADGWQRLPAYRAAVDEVVLRAITPDDSLDAYLRFVDAAASRLAPSADGASAD